MLTMSIPDGEISGFTCSQYGFNLFTRWHQRLWFYGGEFEGIGSV